MAKHSLVIVESPAKAKTIGKYLGKEFEVKACMGHLRDLPKSTLGVDLEHDFEPVYKPIKGKGGHHRRPEEVRQECGDGLPCHRPGPGGRGHLLAPEAAAEPAR